MTNTYQKDLYYRGYRLACTYDTRTNNLVDVKVYADADLIETAANIDTARKDIDEWHNAR